MSKKRKPIAKKRSHSEDESGSQAHNLENSVDNDVLEPRSGDQHVDVVSLEPNERQPNDSVSPQLAQTNPNGVSDDPAQNADVPVNQDRRERPPPRPPSRQRSHRPSPQQSSEHSSDLPRIQLTVKMKKTSLPKAARCSPSENPTTSREIRHGIGDSRTDDLLKRKAPDIQNEDKLPPEKSKTDEGTIKMEEQAADGELHTEITTTRVSCTADGQEASGIAAAVATPTDASKEEKPPDQPGEQPDESPPKKKPRVTKKEMNSDGDGSSNSKASSPLSPIASAQASAGASPPAVEQEVERPRTYNSGDEDDDDDEWPARQDLVEWVPPWPNSDRHVLISVKGANMRPTNLIRSSTRLKTDKGHRSRQSKKPPKNAKKGDREAQRRRAHRHSASIETACRKILDEIVLKKSRTEPPEMENEPSVQNASDDMPSPPQRREKRGKKARKGLLDASLARISKSKDVKRTPKRKLFSYRLGSLNDKEVISGTAKIPLGSVDISDQIICDKQTQQISVIVEDKFSKNEQILVNLLAAEADKFASLFEENGEKADGIPVSVVLGFESEESSRGKSKIYEAYKFRVQTGGVPHVYVAVGEASKHTPPNFKASSSNSGSTSSSDDDDDDDHPRPDGGAVDDGSDPPAEESVIIKARAESASVAVIARPVEHKKVADALDVAQVIKTPEVAILPCHMKTSTATLVHRGALTATVEGGSAMAIATSSSSSSMPTENVYVSYEFTYAEPAPGAYTARRRWPDRREERATLIIAGVNDPEEDVDVDINLVQRNSDEECTAIFAYDEEEFVENTIREPSRRTVNNAFHFQRNAAVRNVNATVTLPDRETSELTTAEPTTNAVSDSFEMKTERPGASTSAVLTARVEESVTATFSDQSTTTTASFSTTTERAEFIVVEVDTPRTAEVRLDTTASQERETAMEAQHNASASAESTSFSYPLSNSTSASFGVADVPKESEDLKRPEQEESTSYTHTIRAFASASFSISIPCPVEEQVEVLDAGTIMSVQSGSRNGSGEAAKDESCAVIDIANGGFEEQRDDEPEDDGPPVNYAEFPQDLDDARPRIPVLARSDSLNEDDRDSYSLITPPPPMDDEPSMPPEPLCMQPSTSQQARSASTMNGTTVQATSFFVARNEEEMEHSFIVLPTPRIDSIHCIMQNGDYLQDAHLINNYHNMSNESSPTYLDIGSQQGPSTLCPEQGSQMIPMTDCLPSTSRATQVVQPQLHFNPQMLSPQSSQAHLAQQNHAMLASPAMRMMSNGEVPMGPPMPQYPTSSQQEQAHNMFFMDQHRMQAQTPQLAAQHYMPQQYQLDLSQQPGTSSDYEPQYQALVGAPGVNFAKNIYDSDSQQVEPDNNAEEEYAIEFAIVIDDNGHGHIIRRTPKPRGRHKVDLETRNKALNLTLAKAQADAERKGLPLGQAQIDALRQELIRRINQAEAEAQNQQQQQQQPDPQLQSPQQPQPQPMAHQPPQPPQLPQSQSQPLAQAQQLPPPPAPTPQPQPQPQSQVQPQPQPQAQPQPQPQPPPPPPKQKQTRQSKKQAKQKEKKEQMPPPPVQSTWELRYGAPSTVARNNYPEGTVPPIGTVNQQIYQQHHMLMVQHQQQMRLRGIDPIAAIQDQMRMPPPTLPFRHMSPLGPRFHPYIAPPGAPRPMNRAPEQSIYEAARAAAGTESVAAQLSAASTPESIRVSCSQTPTSQTGPGEKTSNTSPSINNSRPASVMSHPAPSENQMLVTSPQARNFMTAATQPGPSRVAPSNSQLPGPSRVPCSSNQLPGPSRVVNINSQLPGPSRLPPSSSQLPGPSRVPSSSSQLPGPSRLPPSSNQLPRPSRVPSRAPSRATSRAPSTMPSGMQIPSTRIANFVRPTQHGQMPGAPYPNIYAQVPRMMPPHFSQQQQQHLQQLQQQQMQHLQQQQHMQHQLQLQQQQRNNQMQQQHPQPSPHELQQQPVPHQIQQQAPSNQLQQQQAAHELQQQHQQQAQLQLQQQHQAQLQLQQQQAAQHQLQQQQAAQHQHQMQQQPAQHQLQQQPAHHQFHLQQPSPHQLQQQQAQLQAQQQAQLQAQAQQQAGHQLQQQAQLQAQQQGPHQLQQQQQQQAQLQLQQQPPHQLQQQQQHQAPHALQQQQQQAQHQLHQQQLQHQAQLHMQQHQQDQQQQQLQMPYDPQPQQNWPINFRPPQNFQPPNIAAPSGYPARVAPNFNNNNNNNRPRRNQQQRRRNLQYLAAQGYVQDPEEQVFREPPKSQYAPEQQQQHVQLTTQPSGVWEATSMDYSNSGRLSVEDFTVPTAAICNYGDSCVSDNQYVDEGATNAPFLNNERHYEETEASTSYQPPNSTTDTHQAPEDRSFKRLERNRPLHHCDDPNCELDRIFEIDATCVVLPDSDSPQAQANHMNMLESFLSCRNVGTKTLPQLNDGPLEIADILSTIEKDLRTSEPLPSTELYLEERERAANRSVASTQSFQSFRDEYVNSQGAASRQSRHSQFEAASSTETFRTSPSGSWIQGSLSADQARPYGGYQPVNRSASAGDYYNDEDDFQELFNVTPIQSEEEAAFARIEHESLMEDIRSITQERKAEKHQQVFCKPRPISPPRIRYSMSPVCSVASSEATDDLSWLDTCTMDDMSDDEQEESQVLAMRAATFKEHSSEAIAEAFIRLYKKIKEDAGFLTTKNLPPLRLENDDISLVSAEDAYKPSNALWFERCSLLDNTSRLKQRLPTEPFYNKIPQPKDMPDLDAYFRQLRAQVDVAAWLQKSVAHRRTGDNVIRTHRARRNKNEPPVCRQRRSRSADSWIGVRAQKHFGEYLNAAHTDMILADSHNAGYKFDFCADWTRIYRREGPDDFDDTATLAYYRSTSPLTVSDPTERTEAAGFVTEDANTSDEELMTEVAQLSVAKNTLHSRPPWCANLHDLAIPQTYWSANVASPGDGANPGDG